jgi:hypothetical protein
MPVRNFFSMSDSDYTENYLPAARTPLHAGAM